MTTKKITTWLLLFGVSVWILWDIYVALNATAGDTISEIMLALALRTPIVPFALGVVVGHLFWPQYIFTDSLEQAVARGRALHPWRGTYHQVGALLCEISELDKEIGNGEKLDKDRVLAEAVDVYVCAQRIAEGR